MAERIYFKHKTTECCLVYNYKKQLMGEIRKRRINYYKQWCFHPNYIHKMGDVWYTKSFLKQIMRMMQFLYKNGICVKEDIDYFNETNMEDKNKMNDTTKNR